MLHPKGPTDAPSVLGGPGPPATRIFQDVPHAGTDAGLVHQPPIVVFTLPDRGASAELPRQAMRGRALPDLRDPTPGTPRVQPDGCMDVIVHHHRRDDPPEVPFPSRDHFDDHRPLSGKQWGLIAVQPPGEEQGAGRVFTMQDPSAAGWRAHAQSSTVDPPEASPVSCAPDHWSAAPFQWPRAAPPARPCLHRPDRTPGPGHPKLKAAPRARPCFGHRGLPSRSGPGTLSSGRTARRGSSGARASAGR